MKWKILNKNEKFDENSQHLEEGIFFNEGLFFNRSRASLALNVSFQTNKNIWLYLTLSLKDVGDMLKNQVFQKREIFFAKK
jgi:hypothetical protein